MEEASAGDRGVLLRLMGTVEAIRLPGPGEGEGAAPLVPTRQKGLEAVAYLALRGTAVEQSELAVALFRTDGAASARSLRDAVASARALVGERLLPRHGTGRYELSPRVMTDYGVFCDRVARAGRAEDAATATTLLGEALRLVRGEPLTGVGHTYAWAGGQRTAITDRVVAAATVLAEGRLAVGDRRYAEWAAHRGLAASPDHDLLHRLLAGATAADDDRQPT